MLSLFSKFSVRPNEFHVLSCVLPGSAGPRSHSSCYLCQFILDEIFFSNLRRFLAIDIRFRVPSIVCKRPFREFPLVFCDKCDYGAHGKDGSQRSQNVHVHIVPWLNFIPIVLDGSKRVRELGLWFRNGGHCSSRKTTEMTLLLSYRET